MVRASNRRKSGTSGSACKARRIAKRVASRIFRRSISASLADPMPMPLARRTISANSRIRSGSPTCLESFNPASLQRRGNTTAAATTGPASGPRPASSSPAMRRYPQHLASTSNSSEGPPVVGFGVPAKRAPLPCCQMEISTDDRSGLCGRSGFRRRQLGCDLCFAFDLKFSIFHLGELTLLRTQIIELGASDTSLTDDVDFGDIG